MAAAKIATLMFHIESGLKEALRTIAEREHRSIAKMVEALIRDYYQRIPVEDQGSLPIDTDKPASRKQKNGKSL